MPVATALPGPSTLVHGFPLYEDVSIDLKIAVVMMIEETGEMRKQRLNFFEESRKTQSEETMDL